MALSFNVKDFYVKRYMLSAVAFFGPERLGSGGNHLAADGVHHRRSCGRPI